MKTLIITLLLTSSAFAAPYGKTLRSLLTSPVTNEVTKRFPQACREGLRSLEKKHRKLHSKRMKTMLKPLSVFMGSDGQAPILFFHYTHAEPVREIGHTNHFIELFDYMRSPDKERVTYDMFFYIASDPYSSRSYGPIQLRVFLKPQALLLDEGNGESPSPLWTTDEITAEVKSMRPELATCPGNVVYHLTVEDMGVGLIHYVNDANQENWFQVVTPDVIDHVEAD